MTRDSSVGKVQQRPIIDLSASRMTLRARKWRRRIIRKVANVLPSERFRGGFDRASEAAFQKETRDSRRRNSRHFLTIQFIVTQIAAVSLYVFSGALSILIGLIVFDIIKIWAIAALRRPVGSLSQETIATSAIVAGAVVIQIVALTTADAEIFWVLQMAVVVQPVILATGVQARFPFCLAGCFAVVVFTIVSNLLSASGSNGTLLCLAVVPAVFGVYALLTGFRLELQERRFFMEKKRFQRSARALKTANARLAELSTTDGLTDIANRRGLVQFYDAQTSRIGLGLILIDVDYFKPFNDFYGHTAGDDCLCRLVAALFEGVRATEDRLGRWGGEEFMIVQRTDRVSDVRASALRLLASVSALGIRHERSPIAGHVTISAGYVHCAPGERMPLKELSKQADQALYAAKGAGRNQIFGYSDWAGQAGESIDEYFA